MFRISKDADHRVVDVDTLDEIEPVLRRAEPGRYHIDEITHDLRPSGYISYRWGVGIKWDDGSVMLERDPWP
jgi:hypothetical protein